ncbi:MAG: serine protease [Patescibacteria group bacterium]
MQSSILAKIIAIIAGIIASVAPIQNTAPENPARNTASSSPPVVVVEKTKLDTATTTVKNIPLGEKTHEKPALKPKIKPEINQQAATKPVSPPPPAPKKLIPLEELDEKARKATVNILCTTKTGGDFKPISGSGIIINGRGVILTNAHVAQYLLLKDYSTKDFVTCVARAGSPAVPAYKIEILYFPAIWLAENAKEIKRGSPEGTGENDYALFLITGSATPNPLPSALPFVAIDTNQKNILGEISLLLIGYPASFLGGIATQKDLWITSSPSFITKFYYFNDKTNIDVFSVGSNIIAQKGASGGAVISRWTGKVEAILATMSEGKTTESRELSAITIAHINRSFKSETGKSLDEFLSGNIDESFQEFTQNTLPGLTKTLETAVENISAN